MNIMRPACRVRRSCASIAPSALAEMISRIRANVPGGTASSIRPPMRLFHEAPARPQNVQRNHGRQCRIKNRASSDRCERDPAEYANRGDYIRDKMTSIGHERGGLSFAPWRIEIQAHPGVDGQCHAIDRKAQPGSIQLSGREGAERGFAKNGNGGDNNEHAFKYGRRLCLVMSIRMFIIRRLDA